MPCYSSITETKMTDAQRLAQALLAEGHVGVEVSADALRVWTAHGVVYSRARFEDGFRTSSDVGNVGRKYAELTVREVARRRGFSVATDETGTKLTLRRRF